MSRGIVIWLPIVGNIKSLEGGNGQLNESGGKNTGHSADHFHLRPMPTADSSNGISRLLPLPVMNEKTLAILTGQVCWNVFESFQMMSREARKAGGKCKKRGKSAHRAKGGGGGCTTLLGSEPRISVPLTTSPLVG